MNFKTFYLTESLQTVYHALNLRQLRSILKSNSLEFSPNVYDVETRLGKGNGKYYYLSTMRNKSGTFLLGASKDTKRPMKDAYMELNADNLSNHTKSAPVDYWGAGRKGSEEEERFWSNEDKIKNVDKFVKSIHILLDRDKERRETQRQLYVDIYFYAKFKHIPVYFYDKPVNFIAGKKPVEFDVGKDFYSERPDTDSVSEMSFVVKLMNDEKLTGEEVKKYKYNLAYPVYRQDFISSLTQLVHSSRKTDNNDNKRVLVKEFMEVFKKSKKKTIDDFVNDDVIAKMKERKLYEV